MWRILSLLAVLAFLEVLVPWPDIAALVLSSGGQPSTHGVWQQMPAAPAAPHAFTGYSGDDPPQFLVQTRGASR